MRNRAVFVGSFITLALLAGIGACGVEDCTQVQIIKPDADCCSYIWKDDAADTNPWYRQPKHALADEAAAEAFVKSIPTDGLGFVQPHSGHLISIAQGWIYNSEDLHAGVDYVNLDVVDGHWPTFKVLAMAEGTVVSHHWDDWVGNVVVIEHPAKNGAPAFRSVYAHLRDGFMHDLTNARAIPASAVGTPGDKTDIYRKYAALPDPNPLFWGTDDQTIAVNVGDHVTAGQFIAWAGDTGPGGAGAGIDANGKMTSPSGNVHLHFMLSVADPARAGDWIFVDPYGAYSEEADGCYERSSIRAYSSFISL